MPVTLYRSDTAQLLSFHHAKDDHLSSFHKRHEILHLDEAGKFFDSLLCTGAGVFSDKYIPYQMQTCHNFPAGV